VASKQVTMVRWSTVAALLHAGAGGLLYVAASRSAPALEGELSVQVWTTIDVAALSPAAIAPEPDGAVGWEPTSPAKKPRPRHEIALASSARAAAVPAELAAEPDPAGEIPAMEPPAAAAQEAREADAALAADRAPPPAPAPPLASAAPARWLQLPARIAKALRLYDTFPRLPEPLRAPGAAYVVVLDVCVSNEGAVSDVMITRGATDPLDTAVRAAVRTWRYRPLIVAGTPMPFCHVVQIDYRM